MKIEKINDNQIRCTLTRQDLEEHQIRISELAYGTEKAKRLFHDMMKEAQLKFGFEANNIPLMIEAIPVNADNIILIITKVEDPEELDTRFSKFAPLKDHLPSDAFHLDGADNIIDMFQKLCEASMKKPSKDTNEKESSSKDQEASAEASSEEQPSVNLIRLYTFSKLDDVISVAHALNHFYSGTNTLYKDASADKYLLVLHQSDCSPEEFNKVCNILSEYSKGKNVTPAGEAYLKEHHELITTHAIQQLSQL